VLYIAYAPLPFGRICFVVLVMRKGGEIAVEVVPGICAVHRKFSMCLNARTSSYSPVGPSVFFLFSLGLYFVYLFVLL